MSRSGIGPRMSCMKDAGLGIRCGAVFRFEPDGSGLEMVAEGIAESSGAGFDDWETCSPGTTMRTLRMNRVGCRWWRAGTAGGGSDGSGRRIPSSRRAADGGAARKGQATSPWITEGLWKPAHAGQPAYIVPPVAQFFGGTLWQLPLSGHRSRCVLERAFLLPTDFRGSSNDSLLWRFRVVPDGQRIPRRRSLGMDPAV